MTTVPINPGTATAVLNGSGNGVAKLGPVGARETWTPATVAVSVATNTSEASCRIYAGDSPTPANFIDGTLSGSTGDSTDRIAGSRLQVGDFIWAAWFGGDPGSVGTVNVTGNRSV